MALNMGPVDFIKPNKGCKGGACNRTACQRAGAWWYNKHTDAYYCTECAVLLNREIDFMNRTARYPLAKVVYQGSENSLE